MYNFIERQDSSEIRPSEGQESHCQSTYHFQSQFKHLHKQIVQNTERQ